MLTGIRWGSRGGGSRRPPRCACLYAPTLGMAAPPLRTLLPERGLRGNRRLAVASSVEVRRQGREGRRGLGHPLALLTVTVLGIVMAGVAATAGWTRGNPFLLGSALALALALASVWIDRLRDPPKGWLRASRAMFTFGVLLMALGSVLGMMVWMVRGKPELATASAGVSPEIAVMAAGTTVAAFGTWSVLRRRG